jgi:hypothetical protein
MKTRERIADGAAIPQVLNDGKLPDGTVIPPGGVWTIA